MQKIIVAPLLFAGLLMTAGCHGLKPSATETERALCQAWAEHLILPSRLDTEETAIALTKLRRLYEELCGD